MSASLTPIEAYRHLHRAALAATKYAQPARFTIRNRLRASFRGPQSNGPLTPSQSPPFDSARISRTILFLRLAAAQPGLERKVVRNLVRVWGEQERMLRIQPRGRVLKDNLPLQEKAWDGFAEFVRRLEGSLGVTFGAG